MSTEPEMRWWHSGILGGCALGILTLKNVIVALVFQPAVWREVIFMPIALFAVGFLCGVIAWWLRNLSVWLGWIGDAFIGSAVLTLFFATCMILFDPGRQSNEMLFFGVVIGAVIGILFGMDLRKEERAQRKQERIHAEAIKSGER